ncbi:MAG TPA: immunoglobulin domain-containing protein [Verrucomicrobiae bacterium]
MAEKTSRSAEVSAQKTIAPGGFSIGRRGHRRTQWVGLLASLFLCLQATHAQTVNLTLNVPQNGIEGTLLLQAGTISIDGSTNHPPITVNLFSGNTNRVQILPSVVISPGTNSAHFDLLLVNNNLIEGTENVVIEAWLNDGTLDLDIIRVEDNESRALAIMLPAEAIEWDGALTNAGTISFFGKPVMDVVIALHSDHPELIAVPSLLTNYAGQTNASFRLSISNNIVTNAFASVQLSASATSFLSTIGTITLRDDERFAPFNPVPANFSAQTSLVMTLSWTISSNAPTGIVYDVYFGTNPTPGPAEFLGSTTSNIWTLPSLTSGATYYWKVTVRKSNSPFSPIWRFTTRSVDHFNVSSIASPQQAGEPFSVTVTARDEPGAVATNFSDFVMVRGAAPGPPSLHSILPAPVHTFQSFPSPGTYGYAFTPTQNITVTAVRHYFGTKVSIWTDSGIRLAFQSVNSIAGSWMETPLTNSLTLVAGNRYRVAAFISGTYFARIDSAAAFAHGSIHQAYESAGDAFPTDFNTLRWPLVDLRYKMETSQSKEIIPANSGAFTLGNWTGNITAPEGATNLIVSVRDSEGHVGQSNPFHVLSSNQPILFLSQPASQIILTGDIARLSVAVLAVPPFHYQWRFNGVDLPDETNATLTLANVQAGQAGNYSVVVTNRFGSGTSSVATISLLESFFEDFEPGIHVERWSAFSGGAVLATNYGGSVSGVNSLWLGGVFVGPVDDRMASRFAMTRPLDTRLGGRVDFYLRIADGSGFPWSRAGLPLEGVRLEYFIPGAQDWVEFGRYDSTNYYAWTHVLQNIPLAAQTANTQFRWSQPYFTDTNTAHWALDDIYVDLVPHPITIVAQPTNQLVLVGEPATFVVGIQGSAPLACQWRRNGMDIDGATASTFTIFNVQSNDMGAYDVVITNRFGAVTSASPSLVVLPLSSAIGVFDHPAYVTSGSDNVQAAVQRLGYHPHAFTDLVAAVTTYQRIVIPSQQIRELALDLTPPVSATLSSFVTHGGTLIVQGSAGRAGSLLNALFGFSLQEMGNGSAHGLTAEAAGTAFADAPPSILGNSATTVLLPASFPPGALSIYTNNLGHGAVVAIEWGDGLILFLGWNWANSTLFGAQYGGWQNVLDSALQQGPLPPRPPIIVSQPVSQIVQPGTNVNLTVVAVGGRPLVFQWQRNGVDLVNDGRISGATDSVLTIGNAIESDSDVYSVTVSNALGTATSSNASLAVSPLDHFSWSSIASPQITTVPFGVTIEARDSFGQVVTNFAGLVALGGPPGALSAVSPTSANFINGVWSGDISLPNPATNSYVRAAFAQFLEASNPFDVVRSNQAPIILTNPASRLVYPGSNVILSVRALGAPPITYQWRRSGANLPDAGNISGTASPNLAISSFASSEAGTYSVIVSNAFGTATSSNATLTLNQTDHFTWNITPPSIRLNSSFGFIIQARNALDQFVGAFNGPVALTGLAGGPASITPTSVNFINGGWSGNVTFLSTATNLVLRADDGSGRIGLSNPFHVAPPGQLPIFLTHPVNQVVRPGTNATLFTDAFGASTLSWHKSGTNSPLTGLRYGGQGTTTFIISNTVEGDSGFYFVWAFGVGSAPLSSTSLLAYLTVSTIDHFNWSFVPSPQGTNLAFNVTVTARDAANQFVTNYNAVTSFSASIADTGAAVPFIPVSGTFTSGVWTGSVHVTQLASNVVLRVDDGFGHAGTSVPFEVIAQAPVLFTVQPTNQFVLPGTNVTLVAQAFSASPVTYQWRFEGTNIPNATNAAYSFSNAQLTNYHGTFSCVATDDRSTALSSNALVYVLIKPGIVTHIASQTVLQGADATFSLVATGAPPLSYRWIRNGGALPGVTTSVPVLVITNVQSSGTLRLTVTNAALPSGVFSPGPSAGNNVLLTMRPDFDGDGISDYWETNYFGNVNTTNNASNALEDSDGDGMSNRDEYIAGTNPTNALSVLKIVLTATNANVLQFVAQSNISYSAQWRTNLSLVLWNNLTSITAQPLVRTVQVNTAIAPPASEKFYRVVTPLVP